MTSNSTLNVIRWVSIIIGIVGILSVFFANMWTKIDKKTASIAIHIFQLIIAIGLLMSSVSVGEGSIWTNGFFILSLIAIVFMAFGSSVVIYSLV